jgi:non-heme chloroperoxidase
MAEQALGEGLIIHLEDEGDGRPVVFVHGVMMSGRFFQRQVPHVAAHARAVVPDLRGHGRSDKVLHGHTVSNYAADLHDLFAGRGIEHPVLVGWSMGAMVAYEYLKAFGQDGVAGVVIVDQPPSDFAWEGYEFGSLTVEVLGEMVEGIQMDQQAVAEEFASLMQHEPTDADTSWMVEEIMLVPPAIATSILVNQTIQDYRPFLPEIHIPALVAFGRDPKLTNPAAGEEIARLIPGATLRIFERSSHLPFYEEADAFNETLDAFLDGLA